MSRDLCRSSSSLKTRSRPTQSHRELSNKYPYWAVEWEGVHCNDSVLYLRGFSLFPQLMGQSLKEAQPVPCCSPLLHILVSDIFFSVARMEKVSIYCLAWFLLKP